MKRIDLLKQKIKIGSLILASLFALCTPIQAMAETKHPYSNGNLTLNGELLMGGLESINITSTNVTSTAPYKTLTATGVLGNKSNYYFDAYTTYDWQYSPDGGTNFASISSGVCPAIVKNNVSENGKSTLKINSYAIGASYSFRCIVTVHYKKSALWGLFNDLYTIFYDGYYEDYTQSSGNGFAENGNYLKIHQFVSHEKTSRYDAAYIGEEHVNHNHTCDYKTLPSNIVTHESAAMVVAFASNPAARNNSKNYYANNETTQRNYITKCYWALLGRAPDSGGMATWLNVMKNYNTVLHARADGSGASTRYSVFTEGMLRVAQGIAGSSESQTWMNKRYWGYSGTQFTLGSWSNTGNIADILSSETKKENFYCRRENTTSWIKADNCPHNWNYYSTSHTTSYGECSGSAGYYDRACNWCGKTESGNGQSWAKTWNDKKSHNYKGTWVKTTGATCTAAEKGYYHYVCANNSAHTYNGSSTTTGSALGHRSVSEVSYQYATNNGIANGLRYKNCGRNNNGTICTQRLETAYLVSVTKGAHVATATSSGYYAKGATVSLSATYDTGYEFSSVTGGKTSMSFTMPENAVAVTINAKSKTYSLKFDVNKPSTMSGAISPSSVSSVTMTYASTNNNTAKTLSATGWTFDGWYDAKTGGKQVYKSDGTRSTDTTYWNSSGQWVKTDGLTVYAHWSPKEFTITFDPNGGTVTPTTKSVSYDQTTNNTAPIPTRTSQTFLGWFTDGMIKVFNTNGSCVAGDYWSSTGTWKGLANLKVYALWNPTASDLTVSSVIDGTDYKGLYVSGDTHYIKADGTTPFILNYKNNVNWIKPVANYQIEQNEINVKRMVNGSFITPYQRILTVTPVSSITEATKTITSGFSQTITGTNYFVDNGNTTVKRTNNTQSGEFSEVFTIPDAINGFSTDGMNFYVDARSAAKLGSIEEWSPSSSQIKITSDAKAPTVTEYDDFVDLPKLPATNTTFTFTAVDTVSGVKDFVLEITNTYTNTKHTYTKDSSNKITVDIDGKAEFYEGKLKFRFYTIDNVNNEWESILDIENDQTFPQITDNTLPDINDPDDKDTYIPKDGKVKDGDTLLDYTNKTTDPDYSEYYYTYGWCKHDILLKFTSKDVGIIQSMILYKGWNKDSIVASATVAADSTEANLEYNVDIEGETEYLLQVKDKFGNTTSIYILTRIDYSKSIITGLELVDELKGLNVATMTEALLVTVQATDIVDSTIKASGIEEFTFTLTNHDNGLTRVYSTDSSKITSSSYELSITDSGMISTAIFNAIEEALVLSGDWTASAYARDIAGNEADTDADLTVVKLQSSLHNKLTPDVYDSNSALISRMGEAVILKVETEGYMEALNLDFTEMANCGFKVYRGMSGEIATTYNPITDMVYDKNRVISIENNYDYVQVVPDANGKFTIYYQLISPYIIDTPPVDGYYDVVIAGFKNVDYTVNPDGSVTVNNETRVPVMVNEAASSGSSVVTLKVKSMLSLSGGHVSDDFHTVIMGVK